MNNPLLVTLDNNSIIALENDEEPNATAMKQLIAFHRQGIIKIIVGWRTLLEKPRQGKGHLWFPEEERSRMDALGLSAVELFKTPQTMWFLNEEGFLTYEHELPFLRAIHEILFPNIDFDFRDYLKRYCKEHQLDLDLLEQVAFYSSPLTRVYSSPAEWELRLAREQQLADNPRITQQYRKIREKWTNAKNDALGLCAHTSWRGDIFVTSDKNFYKVKLFSLIPGKILPPKEAVQEIEIGL